jgi:TRAP-type mannitol/chloroaromatic compound transport system permease small subunit
MFVCKFIVRLADAISLKIGKVVSFFILIVMVITFVEIISRYFFNKPTTWSYELGQMIFGSYFLLVGAFAMVYREHIGMDIVINRLSPRAQAIVNSATFPLAALFCFILVWKGGQFAYRSIMSLEHSTSVWGPPIYPYKAMLPFAGFLMLFQVISNFIKDVYFAVTGKQLSEEE